MSRLFSGTPFERPIVCDTCGKAVADCRCVKLPPKKKMSDRPGGKHFAKPAANHYELTPQNSDPPKDQVARIRVEKRKGNRVVTVIAGLEHPANDLGQLLTELKTALGVGGSVQGRTIELQGEKDDAVAEILSGRGYKTRVG